MYYIHFESRWISALDPLMRLCNMLKRFDLFKMLLRNDLSVKFRHSILRILWLLIPPFSIILLYIYVFRFIFKLRGFFSPEDAKQSENGFLPIHSVSGGILLSSFRGGDTG